jgi:hypothetical protein
MKLSIKSLMLVTFAALCLMVVPAFSAQSDGSNSTSCTGSKTSACTGCVGTLSFEGNGWFPGYYPNNAFMNKPAMQVKPVYLGNSFAISGSQYSQYNLLENQYRRFEHIRPCRI